MTRSDYEARRRRLDEEMRAALELLRAGYQTQVQALDLLWRMSTEGGTPPPDPPSARPATGHAVRRRGPGELTDEVAAVLPQLPDLFTKDDIAQALAEPANRISLFRALQELEAAGRVRVERFGRGKQPSVYRKTAPAAPAPDPHGPAGTT